MSAAEPPTKEGAPPCQRESIKQSAWPRWEGSGDSLDQRGSLVASFSLATPDRQKDGQGNWQDKTEWHNLVAFNRTAEIVREYVKKGDRLYIEGKIQTRSCDDRGAGQKKYRTEIFVFDLTLLSGRSEQQNGNGYSRSSASYATAGRAPQEEYADQGITDDDIPF